VLGEATPSWREARREAAVEAILEAAWANARQNGLAGLSLSEVARAVGMKPPSLYSYFDSKHAIYDAMFAQGYRQFIERRVGVGAGRDLREGCRRSITMFIEFALEDPQRHQLLFQRTIPGFEPSEASMAVAHEAYDVMRSSLAAHGVTHQEDLDLVTGVSTGFADQQISNDAGGDRWLRLAGDAADMVVTQLEKRQARRTATTTKRRTR
jgi:AcrR family transcriptional regulator